MNNFIELFAQHKLIVIFIILGFVYTMMKEETKQVENNPVAEEKVASSTTEQQIEAEVDEVPENSIIEFAELQFDKENRLSQGISVTDGDTTQLAIKAYCVNCFGSAVFRVEGYTDKLYIKVMQKEPIEGIYYRTLANFSIVNIPTKLDGMKNVVVKLRKISKKLEVEVYTHVNSKKVPLQTLQSR